MRPIHRILVAVKDPAAAAPTAVLKAAQLARAYGAHLELFHGIATPLYLDTYSYQQSLREIEREIRSKRLEQLEAIAATLRGKGLEISVAAQWDHPAHEAVIRHATRSGADLIIADCHAKPHILPGLLHLTDWELLRASPIPVLLVKTPTPYRRPPILAAVDPSHACAKPANLDSEILRVAGSVAAALRGPLHAVHAYIPLPEDTLSRRLVGETERRQLNARTEVAAKLSLDRAIDTTPISRSRRHLVPSHPIQAIEQTAREIHSGIVVMGAISRSGVRRFLFGNTAEYLLDSLACDLLIVKPRRFSAPLQKRSRGVNFITAPYVPGL